MTLPAFLEGRLSKSRRIMLEDYVERTSRVVRQILANRMAVVGLLIVGFFLTLAIFSPWIAPYGTSETVTTEQGAVVALEPPSADNPLGTTYAAKDVFSLWVYGSRISFLVGITSATSVVIIGTSVGLVAGYYKGIVDMLLMRVVDILYALPATPLILVIAMIIGSSIWIILAAMVLVLWRTMARVIRAQVLSESERPYVKSARAAGASDLRIMYVHIAPNLIPLILVEATFVAGSAIILEAGISFLGLGASTSWGAMLQTAFSSGAIVSAWWWVVPPGISITLLVVSFFYISRGIESVTNPETRTR